MRRISKLLRSASRRGDTARRGGPPGAPPRRIAQTIVIVVLGSISLSTLGDGVPVAITSKSIPKATVQVIDPETGSSSGGGTTDVKVGPGDIISFRIYFSPLPDKSLRGVQAYLTDYIPANTEVVGVRIIDEDGLTIPPRYPNLAPDGCRDACNAYSSVPCSSGTCSFSTGSISQVYGDTGVFFSTDPRVGRTPDTEFLTYQNGIVMSPEPELADRMALFLETPAPYYSHSEWDWVQVQTYGYNGCVSGTDGRDNTPHLYGSPVAGPDTHYLYEATEVSPGVIELNDVTGPWERAYYPGSLTGTGGPGSASAPLARSVVETTAGWDITPANPLPQTTEAVRVALGASRVGEPRAVEITLRVLDTPLDPVQGADVNCAEVIGTDSGAGLARDNPWPLYLPSPACVRLNLLFDIDVDKPIAVTNDLLTYTLEGKNLSLNAQTGVEVKQKWDSAREAFVSATGSPSHVLDCDGDGLDCLIWSIGDLQPSEEYEFTTVFDVAGGGNRSAPMYAVYRGQDTVTSEWTDYTTQAITVITSTTVVEAALASLTDPATAGGTATLEGTLKNDGSDDGAFESVTIELPAGWTIVSGSVALGGTTLTCSNTATNEPICDIGSNFAPGESRLLTFDVNVPAGTATGLYPVSLQVWARQQTVVQNMDFDTYFPALATVAVGQPRSDIPTVDCPIEPNATAITGTTTEADGTTIHIYFNGVERGTVLAAGGTWSFDAWSATFGELYGGLEVRASAEASGELESELSAPCFVTSSASYSVCADGIDNDSDGLIDFPSDPGCESYADGSEQDPPPPECSDGIDNDGNGAIDYPDDLSCSTPYDTTEDGSIACSDGADNDGDGLIDTNDPGCDGLDDPCEIDYAACQDDVDNDGDGLFDFGGDPGCHSYFDEDETDFVFPDDPIKARLLIVFDTSGSMNWNTCSSTFTGGDGSAECPGVDVDCAECSSSTCSNGVADDSRIYKVKTGLTSAVTAYGSVDWGLMRFYQDAVEFACPTENASLSSGGWQGAGAAPCGGGFNAGELLVGFSPANTEAVLAWMDLESNYPGTPPLGMDRELRGSGTTPLAGALDSAHTYLTSVRSSDPQASCRPYRVILVTDGAESCGGDPESAAAGLAADDIPVHVVGFASSDPEIVNGLNGIASAGNTGSAVFADDEAELSTAIASIVSDSILIEQCNGLDDDCDTLIDEDYPELGEPCDNGELGECYETGTIVCSSDGWGTVCDAPAGTPTQEVCNQLDDDCDGLIDDGLSCEPCNPSLEICNGLDDDCDSLTDESPLPGEGDPCGSDIGECQAGVYDCVNGAMECVGGTGPSAEECNDLDDDCDGVTDGFVEECYSHPTGCVVDVGCEGQCRTGLRTCTAGSYGPCDGEVGPTPETCNGLDDDCDGMTDEEWPLLGTACDNGMPATCLTTGEYACLPDGSGVYCTAPSVVVTEEVCNGSDDDCDGDIDEEPLPTPVGDPCGSSQPPCQPGVYECVNGAIECVGGTEGTAEECNGLDDDCDGFVDEAPLPGVGQDCTEPGYEEIGDTGQCELGQTECSSDGEMVCVGYIGPQPEVCNGLDDDCDGVADNEAECPQPEDLCWEGSCISPCPEGEFPCAYGYICATLPEGDYCLPDPCLDETCPEGYRPEADPVAGECTCVDPCEGVTCDSDLVCVMGRCVDCFDPAYSCPEGEVCEENADGVGVCVADPCADIACDEGEQCEGGECCPLACSPACPEGQFCDTAGCAATCREDPCADEECSEGQMCDRDEGTCVADPCFGSWCPSGEVCHPTTGDCIADPCDGAQCPAETACELDSEGRAMCAPIEKGPSTDVLGTGTGGCSGCATSRGDRELPLTALLMWLLVVLSVARFRRRTRD